MSKLAEVLEKYAFSQQFYDGDNLLLVCLGCREKAWLIKDIKHKKKCEVDRAYRAALVLDKESTKTVTRQLKAKVAEAANELESANSYGAKYHIKEIAEVVYKLREISVV